MCEQARVRVLYKKILNFYPRRFREQFGEAMEQTFNDLYNEQKHKTERGLFGFVIWMFVETAMGIVREHLLLITEGATMKNILTNFRSPAIISLVLVVPFMILELVNRRNFNAGFPIPLFVFMWFLPVVFIATLMPIVRNVRAGNSIVANPTILLIRAIFLAFIIWMWFGIVIDQMPCFLGVPNCD